MASVTVSKKGWIVIPKAIRERFNIRPGDKVHILDVGGRIAIVKAHKDPIAAGRGFLKGGPSLTEELLKERAEDLEKEEEGLRPRPWR